MSGAPEIWPQDPWGRVLNGALDLHTLDANCLDIAQTAADLAFERFEDALHSVYLSGSMARGLSYDGSFIIVLRHMRQAVGIDLFCAAAALRVQKLHPEIQSCTFEVFCWDEVFPADGCFSHPRFRIGVNSIAIAGRDLKRLIAPQKLTPAAANAQIVGMVGRLQNLRHRLKAVATESRVRATSRQFAQIALTGAFACVMTAEQIYSEDFETMARYLSLNLPDNQQSIDLLVKLSAQGTSSSLEALAITEDAMTWLPDMAENWLDAHNPKRDDTLKLV
ncbi:MAG: hypothetical protein CMK09_07190 [Ponticaulis sp.]|nr:hypothetical protein [Ponticaulis sp.]